MATARGTTAVARPKSGDHDTIASPIPAKTVAATPTPAASSPSTATPATPAAVAPVVAATPSKTLKGPAAKKAAAAEKAAAEAKAVADAAAAAAAAQAAADDKNGNGNNATANANDHSAEVARLSRRSRAVAADCQRTVERILADQKQLASASFGSGGRPRDDAEKDLAAKMERTRREMERRQRELVAAMAAMVKATAAASSLQGTGEETKKATEYVKVAVRTRPTTQFADDAIKIEPEKNAVGVHLSKAKGHHVNNQVEDWSFGFDNLLHDASQEQVYDACARDIVENVVQGYNGTVLCYGQTGAGKTFTMNGGAADYKSRGIIPRAISHIFRSSQSSNSDVEVLVRVSYLEIYNECFYDLLARPTDAPLDNSDLAVREDEDGQVIVKGLTRRPVDSEEAALNMLFEGETNRSIASHDMNASSTRSHCIFTIWLESRSRVGASEKVMHSKLNLVDLAGSERVGKTGSTGSTLAEAKYINKSLTFLEQVVVALGQAQRDHIPFRQSKLTNVLRDSLGGNCKTRLIANIWCERQQLEETISTLKFATRMMRIALEPTINVKEDPALIIAKQAREIKELKAELAMHDTLTNRVGVAYDVLNIEQVADVKTTAARYVRGEVTDIDVVNLRQTKEMFRQLKAIAVELQHQLDTRPVVSSAASSIAVVVEEKKEEEPAPVVASRGGRPPAKGRTSAAKQASVAVTRTVDLTSAPSPTNATGATPTPSTAVQPVVLPVAGAAPRTGVAAAPVASPTNASSPSAAAVGTIVNGVNILTASGLIATPPPVMETKEAAPLPPPREADAFEDYKRTDGQALATAFDTNRDQLKTKKRDLVSISGRVNDTKRVIDELNQRIATKRAARPAPETTGGVEVVDEEEYAMMMSLRASKKTYQDLYQSRMAVNSEVTYLKNLCDQAKLGLANQFLVWYQAKYGVAPMDAAEEAVATKERELKRAMDEDPEANAYYNARRTVDASLKQAKRRPAHAASPSAASATGKVVAARVSSVRK